MNSDRSDALDALLSKDPVQPEPRSHRRWLFLEWVVMAGVAVGLMAGIVRQMDHLERFQQLQYAGSVCEDLAMASALRTNLTAHPGWAYRARTTGASEKDGPNDHWWSRGTPSYRCAVTVFASEGIAGLPIVGAPTVELDYTVGFSGFPNPYDPLASPQATVTPIGSPDQPSS